MNNLSQITSLRLRSLKNFKPSMMKKSSQPQSIRLEKQTSFICPDKQNIKATSIPKAILRKDTERLFDSFIEKFNEDCSLEYRRSQDRNTLEASQLSIIKKKGHFNNSSLNFNTSRSFNRGKVRLPQIKSQLKSSFIDEEQDYQKFGRGELTPQELIKRRLEKKNPKSKYTQKIFFN